MKKYTGGVLQSTTRYIRAGFLPIQERDAGNNITREYLWGLNYGGGIGGLLNLKQGGLDYNYLYDGKGNVTTLIGSDQIPLASYAYDPFGVLKKKVGTFDQPYQFSTKPYDPQTGKSYFGFRFYDPQIGKWMTRDPLGLRGGINLYGFNRNSPLNWIDPDGLEVGRFDPELIELQWAAEKTGFDSCFNECFIWGELKILTTEIALDSYVDWRAYEVARKRLDKKYKSYSWVIS